MSDKYNSHFSEFCFVQNNGLPFLLAVNIIGLTCAGVVIIHVEIIHRATVKKYYSANSITSTCCGFVLQYIHNKSTTSCGFVVKLVVQRIHIPQQIHRLSYCGKQIEVMEFALKRATDQCEVLDFHQWEGGPASRVFFVSGQPYYE